jgi:hypothetical protein
MTAANAPESEPAALQGSMFLYRLDPIFGASWEKSTAMSDEGADRRLIETKDPNHYFFHEIII